MKRWLFLAGCFLWILSLACRFEGELKAPCIGTYECKPGLICNNGVCSSTVGQVCKGSQDCATGFSCRFSLCISKERLQACSVAGANQQCPDGERCIEGFCAKAREGEPCETDDGCPVDLVCDLQFGKVCRPGERCSDNSECKPGYVCEEDRCVQQRSSEECDTSEDCDADQVCNNGRCERF